MTAWRILPVLLLVTALAGCAAGQAYRDGLRGLDDGKYEEAVARLEEAHRLEPDNLEYRKALRTGREQAVRMLVREGERHLVAGRLEDAEKTHHRLAAIEPDNARAASGIEAVAKARRHAPLLEQAQELFQKKDYNGALGKAREILAENPNHAGAASLLSRIEDQQVRDAHAPLKLKSRYVKPVSLQFRDANVRMVFEALSKTTGINFIFDNDVKSGGRVTIFVNQVSVEDAIDLILAQSQLAQKILNDNTILVYPATAQKHKEYREQVVRSFYLTNIEAKKAQSLLKTMLDAGTTFIEEKSNLLVLRDTPEVVRMAEKLFAAADVAEPEVMLEVEVLEIKRSLLQQIGIDYPDKITFTAANAAGATDKLTVRDIQDLNTGRVQVGSLSLALDIAKQNSDTNVLASPRIRARNKEKARIHIGDRVPVITNAVTPVSTGAPVVTGSIQYLDVGLKLEIEPVVHLDNDVGIKLSLEVSSIVKEVTNSQSGSVAYQVGTRNATTVLRLKDGETQVLAGLINDEERATVNKIPGLGDLPIIGRLFSTNKDDVTKTEIVLSITPRMIRNIARPDAGTTEFWYGSEAAKRGKPLTIQSVARGEPLAPLPPASEAAPAAVVPVAPVPVAPAEPTTPAPPAAVPAGEAPVPAGGGEASVPAASDTPAAPEVRPVAPLVPVPATPIDAATPTSGFAPVEPAAPAVTSSPVPLLLVGPQRVRVGQEFEVALTIKADQPVNGIALQLGYEPEVFQVVSVAEGSFAREPGATAGRFSHRVDESAGRVEIKIAPDAGAGFTGATDVVLVTFKAVSAKAKSQVAMREATLLGPGGRQVAAMAAAPLTLAARPK